MYDHQVLREHQKWALGRDMAGRIYISAQGINAQYSAPRQDALAYARWVSQQPGFEVLAPLIAVSHATVVCAFEASCTPSACMRRAWYPTAPAELLSRRQTVIHLQHVGAYFGRGCSGPQRMWAGTSSPSCA